MIVKFQSQLQMQRAWSALGSSPDTVPVPNSKGPISPRFQSRNRHTRQPMVPVPSWKALAKRFQRFPVPKSNGSLSRTSVVPVPRSPRRAGFPVQIGSPSRTKSVPCPVLVPLSRYGSRCLLTKPAGARLKTLGRMAEMPLSGTAFTRREAILPNGAKHASVVRWTYESASNELCLPPCRNAVHRA